ncbi:MAG: diguanylate cyclase [Polaromonas sp.]|nr:diguanylate cyclase [Polaromonas sp.]
MNSLPDTLLLHCRRLFIRGLTRQVRIGIHDFEHQAPQRIVFDIDLYVPLAASTPLNDRLEEVVDYDFVRGVVSQAIDRGHTGLQETLCDAVMQALLAHPHVVAARVSTRKPDVYDDCEAVGVESFQWKAGQPAEGPAP